MDDINTSFYLIIQESYSILLFIIFYFSESDQHDIDGNLVLLCPAFLWTVVRFQKSCFSPTSFFLGVKDSYCRSKRKWYHLKETLSLVFYLLTKISFCCRVFFDSQKINVINRLGSYLAYSLVEDCWSLKFLLIPSQSAFWCRYWLSVGAQPSEPVQRILFRAGVLPPPPMLAMTRKGGPRDTRPIDPMTGRYLTPDNTKSTDEHKSAGEESKAN